MQRSSAVFQVSAVLALGSAVACLSACSNSSRSASDSLDKDAAAGSDAAFEAGVDAASPSDAGKDVSAVDAAPSDAGGDAPRSSSIAVLATFDKSMGQLSEGLWEVSPNAVEFVGTTGTPITAWVVTASPVTIGTNGEATAFGTLAAGTPQSSYTLGVTTDTAGNVYYAVAAAGAPPNDPAPGIYKFPSGGGGTATAFSLGSAVTPTMAFPNGLDFVGSSLFVADSEGVIYKVDTGGVASVWSQDPLLAPSTAACGGKVPLPIGANGIVHDSNNFYVTNTDYGRLIKIPINADGSAGTAAVILEDCDRLVGADGLLIDPKDNSFIVALNILNQVVRVTPDGSSVTVLASGGPLASPASPLIDMAGGQKRVLVTSSAFFTAADAGSPNLAAFSIP